MNLSGSQLITADGVLGVSGKPIRIFSAHVISSGGGAAVVNLKNGTTSSGTEYIRLNGTTSLGTTFDFSQGVRFPGGCFVDVDGSTTSVLFEFVHEF